MVTAHRSTLKSSHKTFKSRHATKGAIKAKNKGKISKENSQKHSIKEQHNSKMTRKNTAKQLKLNKLSEFANSKKIFDGRHGVPRIVAVIPLSQDCNAPEIIQKLNQSVDAKLDSDIPEAGNATVYVDRFKQTIKYIIPPRNFLAILDAAKVADFVMFVLSPITEVDEYGELCIRTIESQGVSNAIPVISNLSAITSAKRQADVRSSLTSFFTHFFPATDKLYAPDVQSEALNLTRLLCQKFPQGISWRDSRPYLLADEIEFDLETGTVVVEGVLRGKGLNADRLIHVPGHGDYQIDKIMPCSESNSSGDVDMTDRDSCLARPTCDQDSLDELNPIDETMDLEEQEIEEKRLGVRLDGHHYFNDDDMHSDYDSEAEIMTKRNLPEGTSEYQATWIIDDGDEEEQEDNEDDDEGNIEEAGLLDGDDGVIEQPQIMKKVTFSEYEPTEFDDNRSEMFMDLDPEEEQRQLQEFRSRAKEDLDFPDEIEIPPSVSAQDRLHRYRGVKSLANCNWDVEEKDPRAPDEWKRLTRLYNYRGTRARVLKEAILDTSVIEPGRRIRIHLRAPEMLAQAFDRLTPLVLYGLLKHEHQLAVVNMSITPNNEYTEPVAAKDQLIVQCGPRRLLIQPLFSQAGNNASNHVYKYERFLQPGRTSTATVIAPVIFGANVPVLYFKKNIDHLDFIGTGSVMNVDHQRILCKRVIMTGHPFKIHKRLVTIRYMFFNPEDIHWFKAVPLFTKLGRSGYIKESLGTHGYFKATFDGKISSQDTVAMALYKRVWPRVSSLWNGRL